jgi:hypothetical protein
MDSSFNLWYNFVLTLTSFLKDVISKKLGLKKLSCSVLAKYICEEMLCYLHEFLCHFEEIVIAFKLNEFFSLIRNECVCSPFAGKLNRDAGRQNFN